MVSNALRLNLFKLYDPKHDVKRHHKNKNEDIQEVNEMEKTIHIEGMMCPHCEARVKKTLEDMPEVECAIVSHTAGTAVVTFKSEVANDVLKKAIEDQGYKVTGIQ